MRPMTLQLRTCNPRVFREAHDEHSSTEIKGAFSSPRAKGLISLPLPQARVVVMRLRIMPTACALAAFGTLPRPMCLGEH